MLLCKQFNCGVGYKYVIDLYYICICVYPFLQFLSDFVFGLSRPDLLLVFTF